MNSILKTSLAIIGGYAAYKIGRASKDLELSISIENPDDSFEINFTTPMEAYSFMGQLADTLYKHRHITLADIRGILGEPGLYTDTKHGWTSMDDFKVYPDGRVFVPTSEPID